MTPCRFAGLVLPMGGASPHEIDPRGRGIGVLLWHTDADGTTKRVAVVADLGCSAALVLSGLQASDLVEVEGLPEPVLGLPEALAMTLIRAQGVRLLSAAPRPWDPIEQAPGAEGTR